MIILFENHQYPKKVIEHSIPDWMLYFGNTPDFVSLSYVGYSYSRTANDVVFYLPKIFIYENGLAFGIIEPEQLASSQDISSLKNYSLIKQLYSLSMWIYESIKIYRDENHNCDVKLTETETAKSVISYQKGKISHTMMEIYFSFIDFNKEYKDIFLRKKFSSNKGEKISWHKTVSKIKPFVQDNTPFYPSHKTKINLVNYEEELLILYYSVLEFFKRQFGGKIHTDPNYTLITGLKFTALLSGKGVRKLKSIKTHYFSDTFTKLWNLLYNFFDFYSQINTSTAYEEVLITDNYPMIFESMVDSLIGDRLGKNGLNRFYADQKDGKRVDHIYRDHDLFSEDDIYFIGDSKYYRTGALAKGESVEKQFTYAKNIIQYSTDPYSVKSCHRLRYRDPLTEGYNITPNFFISAVIDSEYNSAIDNIKKIGKPEFSCQFKNRLFDRDTLAVHRYSINFLFVLSAYISRDGFIKDSFRNKARKKFRSDIINYINERYILFKVYHNEESTIESIITANFKKYCGKMYSFKNEDSFFIIAFDRKFIEEQGLSIEHEIIRIRHELLNLSGVANVNRYILS